MLNASNSTAAIPNASTSSAIGSYSSQVRMILLTMPIASNDGYSTNCRQNGSLRLSSRYRPRRQSNQSGPQMEYRTALALARQRASDPVPLLLAIPRSGYWEESPRL